MADDDRRERHKIAEEERRERKKRNESAASSMLGVYADFVIANTGIAAATALAYRTGLMPTIERGVTFASRFLDRASAKMPGMDLEDWTIDEYKQFGRSAKEAFKTAKDDYYKIKLDPNDNRTFFGSLHSFMEQQDNGFARAREAEFRQRKIKETSDWFSKKFSDKNFSENETLKFNNFIREVIRDPYNRVAIHKKMRKLGLFESEDKKNISEDIVAKVQELDHKLDKEKESGHNEWKRTADELLKKHLDINNLEKRYGTLRKKNKKVGFLQGLINKIHGENDRAVTIGEIMDGKTREGEKINIESIKYSTIKNGKPVTHDPAEDLRRMNEIGRKNAVKQARIKYARTHKGQKLNDDDAKKIADEFTERFKHITPDASGLRVNNGKLYSAEGRRAFTDLLLSSAANTLPGKILKLRDVNYAKLAPRFFVWAGGELNPVLAAMVNGKDYNNGHLNSTIIMDDGQFYRKEANGSLTSLGNLGGVHLLKGNHGSVQHMLHQMHGSIRHETSGNKFKRFFDLDQNREEYDGWGVGSTIKSFTDKYDDTKNDFFIGNIIDRMTDTSDEALREAMLARKNIRMFSDGSFNITPGYSTDYALNFLDQAEEFKDFLDKNTYGFTRDTARKLAKNADGEAKRILDVLGNGTNDDIEKLLLDMDPESIHNQTLSDLVRRLRSNFSGAKDEIKQATDRSHTSVSSNISEFFSTQYGSDVLNYHDILRKELSKESMLQAAFTGNKSKAGNAEYDFKSVFDSINGNQELTRKEKSETRRLFHFTRYEKETENIPIDADEMESNSELYDRIDLIHGALLDDEGLGKDFVDTVKKMKKEEVSFETRYHADADEIGNPEDFSDWIVVGKGVKVGDVLHNINNWTKFKGSAKKLFKQYYAGRDNMEDVTDKTFAPYFMLSRLSDEMNKVGLGFSRDNLGSTLDMVKAIALKRVIPIGVGLTYAEWLDDTSQEITGQSISGAAAQGVADVDIASRRLMDTFGLTDWLKGEKSINPIMQYWGDHGDFQNAEERRRYYESGYTPVRSGAWWTFGGVNEARGGAIQYWEPTFARRIQSDYKDKSLYNGYFDKWSHSLLPTPSNPLSPIFGLLDPYWLEERHKDDRPYELTGHLFEDGTPWGAVLNPTIGKIIKPQKDLHTIGSWLPFTDGFHYRNINGVDPKSLLHAMNEEIKQKARDLGHRNYIQIGGGQMTPVDIDEYDAPTEDSTVLSVQYKHGQLVRASMGVPGKYNPRDKLDGGAAFNSTIASRNRFGSSRASLMVSPGGDLTQGGGGGGGSSSSGGGGGSASGTPVSQGRRGLDSLLSVNYSNLPSIRAVLDYKLFGGPKPYQTRVVRTDSKGNLMVVNTTGEPADPHARSLFTEDRLMIDKMINGDIGNIKEDIAKIISKYNPRKQIAALNSNTKNKANQNVESGAYSPNEFDEDEGVLATEKLKQFRPTDAMELLNDPDAVSDLIHQGKGEGFVRNAAVSWRLISGIYGYAAGEATGFGVDNKKRIATGQDITSGSRAFWDENLGGLGGSTGEIMRRFIPDFRRGTKVNPLMNTMPDWMPERFRYGDPFTLLPKGEMRLPGKGYESLNKLHPDQFGNYGAFDRMKILADIAPFSPEYRMWRDIAKKTVTDPSLKEQMDEIRERVNEQGKKHDFYQYQVVGRGLEYKNVVVSEVLGYGRFRSGNTIYKVAGTTVKGNAEETMQDVLGRYIHPGQTVTVAADENKAYRTNDDSIRSIDVAVFVNGENIGQEMLKNGDAVKRKGDTSAAAVLANLSPVQRTIGYVSEVIAHLDIPWLSDQFLRVRTPLESYEAEQVYGTPYQTWSHPLDSFLWPAFERAVHDRTPFLGLIGTAARYAESIEGLAPGLKKTLDAAWFLSDRGAFMGAAVSNLFKTAGTSGAGAQMKRWGRHGSAIVQGAHFLTGGNSMLDESLSGANIGEEVARIFKKSRLKGGAVGAAVGVAYRLLFGDKGDWVPKRTKKKWEMQDYFDRLTYLKYTGLFEEAARRAKKEEDIDIKDVLEKMQKRDDANKKTIGYFKKLKKQLYLSQPLESKDMKDAVSKLNKKINELSDDKEVIPGGKWTRAAIIYKQAADATMYGLTKNSSWAQIITALPSNDREYFMEFVKEKDEDKRKEILEHVSPFLRRALNLAWGGGKDLPKLKSNKKFFKKHELPKKNWAGWAPQFSLDDIEVKTIANEGMMLADFGYYDSQLRDPNVRHAPAVNYSNKSTRHNTAAVKKNLQKVLEGRGMKDVDIDIMPGPAGGMTSIKASIKHMLGMRDVQNKINDNLSLKASS